MFKLIPLRIRPLIKRVLLTPFIPALKFLGYKNLAQGMIEVPPSHYFNKITMYDQIIALHNLPSVVTWLESKKYNKSVRGGKLVPWITYPALNYLDSLNISEFKVTEFGAGASTFYFADRAKFTTSFEFDKEYYEMIASSIDKSKCSLIDVETMQSLNLLQTQSEPKYLEFINNDKTNSDLRFEFWEKFNSLNFKELISPAVQSADLIFVDGGMRSLSLFMISELVRSDTIIIVDNSNIKWIRKGIESLLDKGFSEIPFIGPGPLNSYEWNTSFLIKDFRKLN